MERKEPFGQRTCWTNGGSGDNGGWKRGKVSWKLVVKCKIKLGVLLIIYSRIC